MKRPADLKLYSAVVCPFAQRTRILLTLKGLDPETAEVDLTLDSEPWYLELNPEGTVPTIVHRGRPIYESSIVNEYLEDVFPEPRAFPEDPVERAASRILIDYCNRTFIPPFYELLVNQDRARDEALKKAIADTLAYLDERLLKWNPGGEYAFGGRFGMADLAFAPFFQRYCVIEHYRGFRFPEAQGLARVRRWKEALLRHEAVRATSLTDKEYVEAYAGYAQGQP